MDNSLPFLYAAAMRDVAGLEREYAKNKSVLSTRNPEGRTALYLTPTRMSSACCSATACAAPLSTPTASQPYTSHDTLVRFIDYAPSCGSGCSLTPAIVLRSRRGSETHSTQMDYATVGVGRKIVSVFIPRRARTNRIYGSDEEVLAEDD
ncbi:hypothetical protein BJY00DRAFT_314295 [Aspergillus carlsbadensis]|nr:hypothetical protein BJY00DRAFT_314295 [Aspergillus carlsbadensis]